MRPAVFALADGRGRVAVAPHAAIIWEQIQSNGTPGGVFLTASGAAPYLVLDGTFEDAVSILRLAMRGSPTVLIAEDDELAKITGR
jgi:hypothetical protein